MAESLWRQEGIEVPPVIGVRVIEPSGTATRMLNCNVIVGLFVSRAKFDSAAGVIRLTAGIGSTGPVVN